MSDKDIETLENGWLTDEHMLKANNVLKKDYPSVDGLQDTLLQQNFSWDIPSSEFVQVLHVNGNHWITISNIGVSDQSVNVYDSLYNGINQATKELIAKYVHKDKVKINIMNVQQQENESDCGVFAIAFAKCLLEGKDTSEYDFVNPRKHLAQYLPQGIIPEFPKVLAPSSNLVRSWGKTCGRKMGQPGLKTGAPTSDQGLVGRWGRLVLRPGRSEDGAQHIYILHQNGSSFCHLPQWNHDGACNRWK